jgi:acyl-CoA synthetase (AMP-forming)/AMP-acid ligase II
MDTQPATAFSAQLALQPDAHRHTLPRFLEDVVERHAKRSAVVFENRALAYDGIDRRVRRLARGLIAAGVSKGTRVGLLMANRPAWIVAAFAVARAGGVLVPVSTFATAEERDYILRHGDVAVLLMQNDLLKRDFVVELQHSHAELRDEGAGPIRCAALPQLRSVYALHSEQRAGAIRSWAELLDAAERVDERLADAVAEQVAPCDDAMIVYTSGTTARPKGVLHMQRAPVIQSWRFAELMGLDERDRVWTAQPFFWTAGVAMSLGGCFAAGATLILQQSFDPAAALACIEQQRATAIFAWPHQEKAMAEHPAARTTDLSRARKVEFASPLAPLVGLQSDDWGTYGSYGLSETFTLASALPASAPAALRSATSGRPLPGTALRIVDPQTGRSVPDGEHGEIAVKGLTLMRGYYKVDAELCFDADGYFHTQDGGFIDADGLLHWTGRMSNLIKTGGANVSPAEIDERLISYPGLRATVTVGVPHPTLGEAIVLCAVPAGRERPDGDAIRAFLRETLAAYKIPRAVLFFAEHDVAYTDNRKIRADAMRDSALARLAEGAVEIAGYTYGR